MLSASPTIAVILASIEAAATIDVKTNLGIGFYVWQIANVNVFLSFVDEYLLLISISTVICNCRNFISKYVQ